MAYSKRVAVTNTSSSGTESEALLGSATTTKGKVKKIDLELRFMA